MENVRQVDVKNESDILSRKDIKSDLPTLQSVRFKICE